MKTPLPEWKIFSNKGQSSALQLYLKKDSGENILLWNLRNFSENSHKTFVMHLTYPTLNLEELVKYCIFHWSMVFAILQTNLWLKQIFVTVAVSPMMGMVKWIKLRVLSHRHPPPVKNV